MAELQLKGVRKSFGSVEVIKGVDLDIRPGEFVVFVGPSGCGKSTLLRLIAGLEDITGGSLLFDGTVVNDLPPSKRGIAMVFQSYALYPHMTVYDNMAFGMKLGKAGKTEIDKRVRDSAEILQITPYLERLPKQLSGGQRQRVAIGRAIVRDPQVFLFDEPLSNLDAKLRAEMRTEIKKLHQRLGTTIVYVTHDQIEAMTLASRIAILRDGAVQQFAPPEEIYERPANMYVAGFVGTPPMNFLPGQLRARGGRLGVGLRLSAEAVPERMQPWLPLPEMPRSSALEAGREVVLGIRPETIGLATAEAPSTLDGLVELLEPTGADTMAVLAVDGVAVTARLKPGELQQIGHPVRIAIDMSRASLFDPRTELRIA
jgi:multiple sugar transport system ATP-binding protein